MADRIHLGLAVVASPLEVGADEAPALLKRLHEAFVRTSFAGRMEFSMVWEPVTTPAAAVEAGRRFHDWRVDALCVVAASWFEDYLVLDLLEECDVPAVLWARPGMETGSLCGVQQLCFMLKQLAHPYCFLFDQVDAQAALHRAWEFTAAAALRRRLRRARIGYLGHRVEGMTETTAHELALKKVLGPRVVGIDSQVFLERAARVPAGSVAARWEQLKGQVGRVTATDEAGLESLQIYTAMQQVVEEAGLAAVAVGCYPHLMGKVCLAASLLGEQGVPVACEGDVNGALGMLMLTELTGQPVHNTDLLDPIPGENAIVFSHCGSGGFSLAGGRTAVNRRCGEAAVNGRCGEAAVNGRCGEAAVNRRCWEAVTLAPVRLMERGLCCLFLPRLGPVTLVNVVPTMDNCRLGVLNGEAVETDMVFPGNPLRVRFASHYRDVLGWIVEQGLGHHWMAAYGDLRQPLADLAAMTGCECIVHD